MNRCVLLLLLGTLVAPGLALGDEPKPFEFKEGDRIVLLGNTFIEQDQSYGYLETLLTVENFDKNLSFRNLGWSGDTVGGAARARFGPATEGFQHLKEHVLALKPTVLFICYGMNESFAGEAGLPSFVSGLNVLLDTLAPAKARVVLISPIKHQDMGRSLPDPTKHNQSLELYVDAIRKVAHEREYRFVDLFGARELAGPGLTTDGIHLTQAGYFAAAVAIGKSLGVEFGEIHFGGPPGMNTSGSEHVLVPNHQSLPFFGLAPKSMEGEKAADRPDREQHRPLVDRSRGGFLVRFFKSGSGVCLAKIDGQAVVSFAFDDKTEFALPIPQQDLDRLKRLQTAINAKNELYFHRWRPQNETYLFLFRKHEQGQNAREIPLFDPLVEAKEHEIAKLRMPTKHKYIFILKERGK